MLTPMPPRAWARVVQATVVVMGLVLVASGCGDAGEAGSAVPPSAPAPLGSPTLVCPTLQREEGQIDYEEDPTPQGTSPVAAVEQWLRGRLTEGHALTGVDARTVGLLENGSLRALVRVKAIADGGYVVDNYELCSGAIAIP